VGEIALFVVQQDDHVALHHKFQLSASRQIKATRQRQIHLSGTLRARLKEALHAVQEHLPALLAHDGRVLSDSGARNSMQGARNNSSNLAVQLLHAARHPRVAK